MITPRILQRLAAVLILAYGLMLMTLALPASAQMERTGDNKRPPLITAAATEPSFMIVAEALVAHCEAFPGGCSCFLNKIRASCSLVLFCLEAGFCEPDTCGIECE
jgi:hypothetical protein